jgi:hypothetical protein
MMHAYCTYCSAEKKETETPIPAVERYKSKRIQTVFSLAKEQGIKFLILSGYYGLLEAEDKIDFYDHLLLENEVEKKALFVSAQLKEKKISKIIFYTNSVTQDQNLKPYIRCIKIACTLAAVVLELKSCSFED